MVMTLVLVYNRAALVESSIARTSLGTFADCFYNNPSHSNHNLIIVYTRDAMRSMALKRRMKLIKVHCSVVS